MKYLLLFLALPALCLAQKNEVTVSAVGNWNPVTFAYIQHPWPVIVPTNRSSVGGGVTYQRQSFREVAYGFAYEQNPSDGKILGDDRHWYIWPQMRYEIMAIASEELTRDRWGLFVREGAGEILTQGLCHCAKSTALDSGWSHDLALQAGFGVDYKLSPRLAWRAGVNMLASETGCYSDKTCRPTWGAVVDPNVGMVLHF